jgi:hypothetical protein
MSERLPRKHHLRKNDQTGLKVIARKNAGTILPQDFLVKTKNRGLNFSKIVARALTSIQYFMEKEKSKFLNLDDVLRKSGG